MHNKSVYGPRIAGAEALLAFENMPDGTTVRLYSGLSGARRCALYDQQGKGLAGLWLDRFDVIQWRQTAKHAQGRHLTRQLVGWLACHGIKARASQWQTNAGRACYAPITV